MGQPRKIFISYRRSDNPDFVDRIRDWFIQRYGRENVFMDFDSIPPMVHFADYIRKEVEECDAMIAIIGPHWLELLREKAAAFEEDYVRIEVGLALKLGKPVAPICIVGASMPRKADLPLDLQPLLVNQAAFLERTNFLDRITQIVDAVEQSLNQEDERKAQVYFDSAESKMQARDFDGTIADCTLAIQLKPDFTEAYSRRGAVRFFKGDHEGAIADFSEAIRLNPQDANTYLNRGFWRRQTGDNDGAIADYSEVIRLNPEDAVAYSHRGHAREDKGDFDGAIADYSEVIRLISHETDTYISESDTYISRGGARQAKGDLRGAIEDYQRYLDLGGGKHFNTQAVVEELIKELQERLPKPVEQELSAEDYFNKAHDLINLINPYAAIANYTEAIRLNPLYVEAYVNRGKALYTKGDRGRAIADFDEAIRLDPQCAEAYNNRGDAYGDKGDLDKAIADYTEAIRLNPQYDEAYLNRGAAFYDKGGLDEAIADYTEAIRLNPQDPHFYHCRAIARIANGDLDGAITDYSEMIQLNPYDIDAYSDRGNARKAQGDFKGANADYKRYRDLHGGKIS